MPKGAVPSEPNRQSDAFQKIVDWWGTTVLNPRSPRAQADEAFVQRMTGGLGTWKSRERSLGYQGLTQGARALVETSPGLYARYYGMGKGPMLVRDIARMTDFAPRPNPVVADAMLRAMGRPGVGQGGQRFIPNYGQPTPRGGFGEADWGSIARTAGTGLGWLVRILGPAVGTAAAAAAGGLLLGGSTPRTPEQEAWGRRSVGGPTFTIGRPTETPAWLKGLLGQ